jgi:long-chain acyl-CoA synthetase
MNVALWLHRIALTAPARPALFEGAAQVADYAGFARAAAAIAGSLKSRGTRPGDRIALFAGNSTAYLKALYGIWHAGAVAVPINGKLHPREAAWIVENAGAKLVFTDEALETEAEPISLAGEEYAAMEAGEPSGPPFTRAPDDLCWLFYTSGTTGRPKGVMLTHGNLAAMAFSYFVDVDAVEPTDTALYAAPLSHGAGLYNFMHVMKGARHAVPASGGFDAEEIFDLAATLGSIHMFAAPTMVRRLVAHAAERGLAGEGIKTIVYGGGPMYLSDIIEADKVLGPRFAQIYGQGETPMTITAMNKATVADRDHKRWRERLASVGTAQSIVEIMVADEAGKAVPAGETGEIFVRGPSVMRGYWRNDEATAETLKDGWLLTGDMGALDEEGFLTLKDRSKDVIITGGTNVYPREVEEVLLAHPAVTEASVIGVPDPEWGERIVAFLVAAGEAPPEAELDALCLQNLARFKRPKRYVFLTELPKNNYGKVLKTALRERPEASD